MAFFKCYMYNMTKGENVAFNIHGLFFILMLSRAISYYDVNTCFVTLFGLYRVNRTKEMTH